MFYTTDTLLSAIKLACLAPVAQQTFADSDLVTLLNEEIQITLVPQILSARSDFFLRKKTVSLVANTSDYALPERAIGNALKQVFYLDSNGNRKMLIHEDVEVLNTTATATTGAAPSYFFFHGDKITVYPTPTTATGSLELWYFLRPNQLVVTTSAAKITNVATNGSNQDLTVNTDLTGSVSASTTLDLLSGKSPFQLWASDVVCQSATSTVISVPTASVTDSGGTVLPAVGDWVCLSQQAVIPMVPQELHPLLPQMVAGRLMDALGDDRKGKMIMDRLNKQQKAAFNMIVNRIENQPDKIIRRSGLLEASGFGLGANTYYR